ncbi:DUF2079 domain-containing protein [Ferroplasma acidiphilum]|uniref:DUF2079 domain-containing protein n=1 Tax=Ferroplasma acidiphilum TaxID=74969 RepID=A0A7K4FQ01_9ARCH|nr:DUF2079 domain-containing protein [Ferroplasma acidiphilum]NOL60901.1 DUF2079 domain-containing protein [Ferroplasma acidiphilum]
MEKNTARDLTIIIPLFIILSIASSLLSYMRYITFHSTVFDLGVSSDLIKNALTSPVVFNKLIYFLMYPLYNLFPSQIGLLVFQDVLVSAGVFPVYFIGRRLIKNHNYSLLLSLIWLFYFPLAGVEWFDFHFIALFPTLFLTGYCLILYDKFKSSLVFILLAITTDYLAPVIVVFYLILLAIRHKKVPKYYYTIIITLIAIPFIGVNIIYPSYTFQLLNISAILKNPSIITASLFRKILYFVLDTTPLLFISFFVPEILLILPYAGLVFAHNYFPYYQPIFYQYPALIAPGIFIAAAVFIGKHEKSNFHHITMKKFITVAFAVAIITWLLFTPYGNLVTDNNHDMGVANYLSMGHYDTYPNIHYTAYDRELQSMVNSIPKGSSVAIQNNMPQLAQFYNYTLPVNGYNGTPQYIIADPYSIWFYNLGITSNAVTDTLSLVNHKLNSGDYGILMEESGMVLLENNYKGNITNFVPYKTTAFNNAYINFLAPGEYMVNINNNITISSEQKTFTVNSDNGIVSFTLNEYLTGVKVATESTGTFTITQI